MAKRRTIHVLKNNQVNNGALPNNGSIQMGEPLVNLYNGILFFSANTSGNYVPSDNNPNYFEVGSNLYNLEIRNRIKRYENQTNLTGLFLSGTTDGFVLAPISAIAGSVDSYTTGATWTPNTLTLNLNQGKPSVPVTIDSFNGLTLYGTTNVSDLTVSGNTNLNGTSNYNQTVNGGSSTEIVNVGYLTAYTQSTDVYVTGNTLTGANSGSNTQTLGLTYHGTPVGGPYILTAKDTFTTGGTYSNSTKNITFTRNDSAQYTVDLSNIDTNDTYVTGGTVTTAPTNNSNLGVIGLKYNQDIPDGTYSLPFTDAYTTGGTLSSNILSFRRNDGGVYSIDLNSLAPTGSTSLDKYVTGFTYNNNNVITISQNLGVPDLTVNIGTLGNINTGTIGSGTITATGDISATGNISGTNVTASGNLTVNGFVNSNLTPTTGCTYDLGSSTNRWNDIWAKRVRIGTCTTDLEDDSTQFILTVGGTSSGATFNLNGGDLNVGGDILPTADLTYNLGAPSLRWNYLYSNNLALSNLTPGQVIYVGASNELKTDTVGQFAYNDSTNTLTIGTTSGKLVVNNGISDGASTFGQGGLVIGSGGSASTPGIGDLTVHGNLVVFGTGTTIATSELYVEDPQITLNYSPSGNTAITSIASGIRIQDGNGLTSGNTDVYLTIAQMNTFTGGNVSEYTGTTGYANRAFLTQLNDIVIRNTNLNNGAPDGVRVLAEFDILDGGTY